MTITSQDGKNTLDNSSIHHIHHDEYHALWAHVNGKDEPVLLGRYATQCRALEVSAELTSESWDGRDYQMPAD